MAKLLSQTSLYHLLNSTTDLVSEQKKSIGKGAELDPAYLSDMIHNIERFNKSNNFPKQCINDIKAGNIILLDPKASSIPASLRYIPMSIKGKVVVIVNTVNLLKLDEKNMLVRNNVTELYGIILGASLVLESAAKPERYRRADIFADYVEYYSPIMFSAILRTEGIIVPDKKDTVNLLIALFFKTAVFDDVRSLSVKLLLGKKISHDLIDFITRQYDGKLHTFEDLTNAIGIVLKTGPENKENELIRQLSSFGDTVPFAVEYLPYGLATMAMSPLGDVLSNSSKMKMTLGNSRTAIGRNLFRKLK